MGHKSTRGNEMSLVVGPGGNHSRVQRSWAGSLRMASNFRKTPVSSRWCPSPNSPAPGCTMKSPRVPQSLRHRLPEYSHPRRLQRRARQKNWKLQPLLYNNSSDTLSILSPFPRPATPHLSPQAHSCLTRRVEQAWLFESDR